MRRAQPPPRGFTPDEENDFEYPAFKPGKKIITHRRARIPELPERVDSPVF